MATSLHTRLVFGQAKSLTRPTKQASRALLSSQCRYHARSSLRLQIQTPLLYASLPGSRQFHASPFARAGLMPDTDDPQPKESEAHDEPTAATELDPDEFHKLADDFLENVLVKVEKMQESEQGIDIEHSAGVMTIEISGKGSYVLNKQPPNKQIWLSSPESGPKRYDWVVSGESMNQKEGSGSGGWIYLRDGSSLEDLLKKEIGVDLSPTDEEWQSEHDRKVIG